MPSDYVRIREENKKRYGTDIGRIGPMLLADRYDDRTHFIFELLQNAEDALARRAEWQGSRTVSFRLTRSTLRVSHYGRPFDYDDVKGICGIGQSTKDLTAIGRFGIGFKSVYAFTDRPEIHSGLEDFAIENFVWPTIAPVIERDAEETMIVLPLRGDDLQAADEIESGLKRLGGAVLLFLRQIKEINWRAEGGMSGLYLRDSEEIGPNARRVAIIGQQDGEPEVDETWLVFSRPMMLTDSRLAGYVELAFLVTADGDGRQEKIRRVERSPLVAFFPTVLETHLGFLVQGPYRTTPSRDNVPRSDPWNRKLIDQTALLLVEALGWLRDRDLLNVGALRSLPIESAKFAEGSMFRPLFEATKKALRSEPLLPRFDAGYASAERARLARTQELRELVAPRQLAALHGAMHEMAWLSGEITQDRTPDLRTYLIEELDVTELTPDTFVTKLDEQFLKAQPDTWVLMLYEFLNGQQALRRRLAELPLIRLEDGRQVVPSLNGQPQAFLPGQIKTAFPTVRSAVCSTETAREFLRSLGLTEPDPVDDVVRNILPKYRNSPAAVTRAEYDGDIDRILKAFATDSKTRREKLISALRETPFVKAIDTGNGKKGFSRPEEVYVATERLTELFAEVQGVLVVDNTWLRGEDVRDLLEACGSTRYLQPIPAESSFSWAQRQELRKKAGCENMSYELPLVDQTLRGLGGLLTLLPGLDLALRNRKAALLWEALDELEDRRGTGVFSGTYRWNYYQPYSTTFDAAFVRQLNDVAWIPDPNGELQRPEFMLFDRLGWKVNSFLQSKIHFKPPVIEQLAKEVGIEPEVLDLLKKHGITDVAKLISRLGLSAEPKRAEQDSETVEEGIKNLLGDAPEPSAPEFNSPVTRDGASGGATDPHTRTDDRGGATTRGSGGTGATHGASGSGSKGASHSGAGGLIFISYVSARPDDEEPDPDGLDQAARIALEEKAIALILHHEPQLQRTPTHNPGFDLQEIGVSAKPVRWIEVKAMTGGLHNRPVGLSHTQFACAQEHKDAYWLYVVEHAGSENARIVRIQDPAGKARTFTFDRGWLSVADVIAVNENIGD
jgi:hypothetical protein